MSFALSCNSSVSTEELLTTFTIWFSFSKICFLLERWYQLYIFYLSCSASQCYGTGCFNNGTCVPYYICLCTSGYSGPTCQDFSELCLRKIITCKKASVSDTSGVVLNNKTHMHTHTLCLMFVYCCAHFKYACIDALITITDKYVNLDHSL